MKGKHKDGEREWTEAQLGVVHLFNSKLASDANTHFASASRAATLLSLFLLLDLLLVPDADARLARAVLRVRASTHFFLVVVLVRVAIARMSPGPMVIASARRRGR